MIQFRQGLFNAIQTNDVKTVRLSEVGCKWYLCIRPRLSKLKTEEFVHTCFIRWKIYSNLR